MRANEQLYVSDDARLLARRVERALFALTDALNSFTPASRQLRASRKLRRPLRSRVAERPRPQAAPVLRALAASLLLDKTPDGLGAVTWEELKRDVGMTDDVLGLVLSVLIPRYVCTRDTGEERIYFLPRDERRKLRALGAGAVLDRAA